MIPLFWSKPKNLFILILQHLTLFNFLGQIMLNYLFCFALLRLILWFKSAIFWLALIRFRIQTQYIWFGHKWNHKKHFSSNFTALGAVHKLCDALRGSRVTNCVKLYKNMQVLTNFTNFCFLAYIFFSFGVFTTKLNTEKMTQKHENPKMCMKFWVVYNGPK